MVSFSSFDVPKRGLFSAHETVEKPVPGKLKIARRCSLAYNRDKDFVGCPL
jgi:hypothetical protein